MKNKYKESNWRKAFIFLLILAIFLLMYNIYKDKSYVNTELGQMDKQIYNDILSLRDRFEVIGVLDVNLSKYIVMNLTQIYNEKENNNRNRSLW